MRETVIITGGAGFIGTNSARYFAERGWKVVIVDNLSRRGARQNLEWLKSSGEFDFRNMDVRNFTELANVVGELKPELMLHLAGQVAVTTSVQDPREDFEINALGSFNVLEAIRLRSPDSFLINASTNKVYGKMDDVPVVERNGRYEYASAASGIGEAQPLDFHSPYGCSKGVADQYTIDYARIYGLGTTCFRQSCIYGTRQFGIEDQGWVAWFTIAAILGKRITIYGDGKQIRDVLEVTDLCRAYEAAYRHRGKVTGKAFNIGGGPERTMSLLELRGYLEQMLDRKIDIQWDDWRPGDQPVFVCDVSRARDCFGWRPTTWVEDGVRALAEWVKANRGLFSWLG